MGVARNFRRAYLRNSCELKPKILHVSVFQVDVLRKKYGPNLRWSPWKIFRFWLSSYGMKVLSGRVTLFPKPVDMWSNSVVSSFSFIAFAEDLALMSFKQASKLVCSRSAYNWVSSVYMAW